MPSTYQKPLKALRPLHFEILKLYLQCVKQKDISKILNVSQTTVSHTLNDPKIMKILNYKLSKLEV